MEAKTSEAGWNENFVEAFVETFVELPLHYFDKGSDKDPDSDFGRKFIYFGDEEVPAPPLARRHQARGDLPCAEGMGSLRAIKTGPLMRLTISRLTSPRI